MEVIAIDQKPLRISPLDKAKSEMDYFRRMGNIHGYKQAKKHYERLLRKERYERK